jgi:hypothetical protein
LLLVLICRFFETGGGPPDGDRKDRPENDASETAPQSDPPKPDAEEEADR